MCHPDDWPRDMGDHERVACLPLEAKRAIEDHGAFIFADKPCVWLDPKTMRCRWYDHRPQVCRNLEIGSEGCIVWRAEYIDEILSH